VRIDELWLTDFRSYHEAHARFAPGLTAVVGANGQGKTNLVEGLAFTATASSFRGAPNEALIRRGAERAIVRAQAHREHRSVLIEAELSSTGRSRIQINRQRLPRTRDLLGGLRVTVFSPDDLELVKGGRPSGADTSTTSWWRCTPETTSSAAMSTRCSSSAMRCFARRAAG
jgi:DNA replication and repair protein RecF